MTQGRSLEALHDPDPDETRPRRMAAASAILANGRQCTCREDQYLAGLIQCFCADELKSEDDGSRLVFHAYRRREWFKCPVLDVMAHRNQTLYKLGWRSTTKGGGGN